MLCSGSSDVPITAIEITFTNMNLIADRSFEIDGAFKFEGDEFFMGLSLLALSIDDDKEALRTRFGAVTGLSNFFGGPDGLSATPF